MKNLLPKREQNSNKGTFGTVLNIAGSSFYSGAAFLSSISALKVGAGKVMLTSTKSVCEKVAILSPEIIFHPLEENQNGSISEFANLPDINDFSVVSIGCGLSQKEGVLTFFEKTIELIKKSGKTCIIDADGLNLLAKTNIKISDKFILTPHPKELSRLMWCDVEEIIAEPKVWVRKCNEKYKCITVLKMHETLICSKDEIYENKTGNSALAKAGTGDVLTGMISGFLSQGLDSFNACKLAVHLHGIAGELASKDLTEYSVLASDLLNYIPAAIEVLLCKI